jgi:aryl-alcohol dehydrogenase-like predicted oxidoreductase
MMERIQRPAPNFTKSWALHGGPERLPQNPRPVHRGLIERACEASLQRLKAGHLDPYLLHRRGTVPPAQTVQGMEALVCAGKIRLGGSNLNSGEIDQLSRADGERCASDQISYNVWKRGKGAEFYLLPQFRKSG